MQEVVELLAACRTDDLDRLEELCGQKKMLGVHRALRAQAFLQQTRADLAARAAKREEALAAGKPPRKVLPKESQEAFLLRLTEDAHRRTKNREQLAAQAEHAALSNKAEVAGGGSRAKGNAKPK